MYTHSNRVFGKAQVSGSRECTGLTMTDDEQACNTAENSIAKSISAQVGLSNAPSAPERPMIDLKNQHCPKRQFNF